MIFFARNARNCKFNFSVYKYPIYNFNFTPEVNKNYLFPFLQPSWQAKSQYLFSDLKLEFVADVDNIEKYINHQYQTPKQRKEFIVFGRSNVGKSSLVNSLLKYSIAPTSKTPGKTQTLQFYKLNNNIYLIDSPGYGFTTKVAKKQVDSWKRLIAKYLKSAFCHRIFCLVDSQHGIKKSDQMLFQYLQTIQKNFVVIFTKCDKKFPNPEDFKPYKEKFAHMNPFIHFTSSKQDFGIKELKLHITYMMQMDLIIPS